MEVVDADRFKLSQDEVSNAEDHETEGILGTEIKEGPVVKRCDETDRKEGRFNKVCDAQHNKYLRDRKIDMKNRE